MRVLLENTTFPLHKVIRIAGIIRVEGIIRGRALYEEIRYMLLSKVQTLKKKAPNFCDLLRKPII